MRIPIVATALGLVSGLAAGPARAVDRCDTALAAALDKPVDRQLAALRKVERRCGEHVPTLVALAFHHMGQRSEQPGQWRSDAVDALERALALEPGHVQARWGASLLLEYLGAYERALPHAEWLAGPAAPENGRVEAAAHAATCRFMAALSAGEDGGVGHDDDTLRARAGWRELQKVAAAVAMAAGIDARHRDRDTIDRLLGLMEDWTMEPGPIAVPERAVLLGGAVHRLATLVRAAGLETALAGALADEGLELAPWPPESPAGLEAVFDSLPVNPGRSFAIGEDLTVTEVWDVPDLTGEWTFRRFAAVCSESIQLPATRTLVTVEQQGTDLTFGQPPFRCRMRGRGMGCVRREPRGMDFIDLTLSCQIAEGDDRVDCDYEAKGSTGSVAPTTGTPYPTGWTCEGKATFWRGDGGKDAPE